jgi:hypothetical protein
MKRSIMKRMMRVIAFEMMLLLGCSFVQAQDEPASRATVTVNGSSGGGGSADGQTPQVFANRLQRIATRPPGNGKPLILRSSSMEPKDQADLEEDLAVMEHILNKAMEELPARSHVHTAMGIDVFLGPGSSVMRDFYLEGYGAVFTVNVAFPLVPPPSKAEPKVEEGETDSAWEEARQELYGQGTGAGLRAGPVVEYSEDKVKELKDKLLESLKSASNIRHLKSEDFVTVCVFGTANGGGPARPRARSTAKAETGGKETQTTTREYHTPWVPSDRSSGTRGTMMTFRVKRADVDGYAKGKLVFEQFRQRVETAAYVGGAVGGGPTGFGMGSSFGGGGFGGFGDGSAGY